VIAFLFSVYSVLRTRARSPVATRRVSSMRTRAWPSFVLVAVGIAGAALACSSSHPVADAGPNAGMLSRNELLDANTCNLCHKSHYDDWSHSVHAYASDDPVFVAMNKRGQRETNGSLGDFCVKCHAPMAVIDGKTTDGLNLASLEQKYKGVTCFFCHTVDALAGTHNAALSLSGTVIHGEYSDPVSNGAHGSTYTSLFNRDLQDTSRMCGACHDIVVRNTNAFIERTFCEWTHSAFNNVYENGGSSCVQCHMDEGLTKVPIAQAQNVPVRTYHSHLWPGVDVPLNAADDVQKTAVQSFLGRTFQGALCVTGANGIRVILDPVNTGHQWPTGSAQDRRAWAEVIAYSGGSVIYSSGVVPDGMPVVDVDPSKDPDLWLLRDQMFGADGSLVSMFWQAASAIGNEIPELATFDRTSLGFYRTHVQQLYPRFSPGVPKPLMQAPDRVTLRMRLQPIGQDVLNDLVQSGDLDPNVAASMPTYDVSFTMPDGSVQPTLEWTPASANYMNYADPLDHTTGTCTTTHDFDPTADKIPAPEMGDPQDCSDGGAADASSFNNEPVDAGAASDGDAGPVCDPRYTPDNIVPGLTKQGDMGALTFVLVSADQVPPVANWNTWVVKVLDKSGQPVTNATFTKVKTYMPLHGHPSSVVPTVTNNGDGTYTIKMYLFMPGVWQVTPYVTVGSTMDQVTYSFCAGG
jgi:hypothetical protein